MHPRDSKIHRFGLTQYKECDLTAQVERRENTSMCPRARSSGRAVKKLKVWARVKSHKAITDIFQTKMHLKGAPWECMPSHLKSSFLRQCFPYWLKFISTFFPLALGKGNGVYHVRCSWPSPLYHWELVLEVGLEGEFLLVSHFSGKFYWHKKFQGLWTTAYPVCLLWTQPASCVSQTQLVLCACQLNKTHFVKASCLSKLINPSKK